MPEGRWKGATGGGSLQPARSREVDGAREPGGGAPGYC